MHAFNLHIYKKGKENRFLDYKYNFFNTRIYIYMYENATIKNNNLFTSMSILAFLLF